MILIPSHSLSLWVLVVACTTILPCGLLAAQDGEEGQDGLDGLNGEFSTRESIGARLKQVRVELKQLEPKSQPELRKLLIELESTCLQHLNDIAYTEEKLEESKEAGEALQAWKGLSQLPPYFITFVDNLRMTRVQLEAKKDAIGAMIRIFTKGIEEARDQLAGHQQTERRLDETADSDADSEEGDDSTNAAARQAVASRIAAERVSRFLARQTGQRAELATTRSRLDLTSAQLEEAEKDIAFTREELIGIQKQIADRRAESVKALHTAISTSTGDHDVEGWMITFLDLEKEFWIQRFKALSSDSPKVKEDALREFLEQQSLVEEWGAVGKIRASEAESEGGDQSRFGAIQDAREKLANQKLRLEFAIAEVGGTQVKSFNGVDRIINVTSSIWNMELYLAEEDAFIDGKKVTSYRAVTLGKLLRLTMILVVGCFLLRFLSGRLRKALQKRGRTTEAALDLASRAFFGMGLFLILIYGLHTAHIPFTAFAFLGGALAIGVGFGTQTLLKNLISGIILIFERPFKVGDVLEADGVLGRIRRIGIRASIVQHFDGIETLIPNSCLLENQVTNWSFSDSHIRHSINIGVAYGSPARDVANKLLEVADEHGLVLSHPKPEVRFEDFGDNALIFQLLFWFDGSKTQPFPLASDLRFMIDKAFSDAGIVIAYPQRDIHLDTSSPLKVEFSRGRSRE